MKYNQYRSGKYDPKIEAWLDNPADININNKKVVYLGYVDTYSAHMFRFKGETILAVGCRRFTLPEAKAHWNAIRETLNTFGLENLNSFQRGRHDRALDITTNIIPKAIRAAKRRGWKI